MKPIVYTVREVEKTTTEPARKLIFYTDTVNKYTAVGKISDSPAAIIANHIYKSPDIDKLWENYSDFIKLG